MNSQWRNENVATFLKAWATCDITSVALMLRKNFAGTAGRAFGGPRRSRTANGILHNGPKRSGT